MNLVPRLLENAFSSFQISPIEERGLTVPLLSPPPTKDGHLPTSNFIETPVLSPISSGLRGLTLLHTDTYLLTLNKNSKSELNR